MNDLVRITKDNDVAVITIDNPPVNALSHGIPEGIETATHAANADPCDRFWWPKDQGNSDDGCRRPSSERAGDSLSHGFKDEYASRHDRQSVC